MSSAPSFEQRRFHSPAVEHEHEHLGLLHFLCDVIYHSDSYMKVKRALENRESEYRQLFFEILPYFPKLFCDPSKHELNLACHNAMHNKHVERRIRSMIDAVDTLRANAYTDSLSVHDDNAYAHQVQLDRDAMRWYSQLSTELEQVASMIHSVGLPLNHPSPLKRILHLKKVQPRSFWIAFWLWACQADTDHKKRYVVHLLSHQHLQAQSTTTMMQETYHEIVLRGKHHHAPAYASVIYEHLLPVH